MVLDVKIERILPGGVGLAHAEGRTLLVALAAPGDRLRVRVERQRKRIAFGSIIEIIEPSRVRVEPPCPYFGHCGGCDFQQLSYQAQLEAKVEMIRDCLRRIAHLAELPEIGITPAPKTWHYRTRAEWQFDAVKKQLGYFARGSHRVCDVSECAILAPELQETLAELRGKMRKGQLAAGIREFQAVAGDDGISLAPPPGRRSAREVDRTIGSERYGFNAATFFQTNHDLLSPLVDAALGDARGEVAIDLYCGVGLFTLPLARKFARVVGVESNPTAARFARKNLADAGISNVRIERLRASDWLGLQSGALASVGWPSVRIDQFVDADFLLLDPPRTGAERFANAAILALRPKRISYVSCDPATLARDLKFLLDGGYALDSIAAFDLFPQTHHVETVSHLRIPAQPSEPDAFGS
jgi:23S rRNA (uracil1939-C5)-methyltransferase